ncbi:hypothetical protein BJ170DRAFT_591163 [Xylariales sp. AK1849]|nr:hypothetical protein BJ170DRAFT_591163 [Xylariales sp. AK1849]
MSAADRAISPPLLRLLIEFAGYASNASGQSDSRTEGVRDDGEVVHLNLVTCSARPFCLGGGFDARGLLPDEVAQTQQPMLVMFAVMALRDLAPIVTPNTIFVLMSFFTMRASKSRI